MAKKTGIKPIAETKSVFDSRLHEMRRNLRTDERRVLNLFWEYFQQNNKWPMARLVHSQYKSKQRVRNILRKLGGDIVRESQNYPLSYELTFIGILLTKNGERYFQLILKYIAFLREKYLRQPEILNFSDREIADALCLSDEDTKLIGFLIDIGYLSAGGGRGCGCCRPKRVTTKNNAR